jgi:hypothetical protein
LVQPNKVVRKNISPLKFLQHALTHTNRTSIVKANGGIKGIFELFKKWFDNRWPSSNLMLVNDIMMDFVPCALTLERENPKITHLTLFLRCLEKTQDGNLSTIRDLIRSTRLRHISLVWANNLPVISRYIFEYCEGILFDSKDLESILFDNMDYFPTFQLLVDVLPQLPSLRKVYFQKSNIEKFLHRDVNRWIRKLREIPLLAHLSINFGITLNEINMEEFALLIGGVPLPSQKNTNQLYKIIIAQESNNMGTIMKAFENGFKNPQCYVGKLHLNLMSYTPDVTSIYTALRAASNTLRHLKWTGNNCLVQFVNLWIDVLKSVPLESFHLSFEDNVSELDEFACLMKQLSETTSLTSLSLINFTVYGDAVTSCEQVAKIISDLKNLKTMILKNDSRYPQMISSDSVETICNALRVNKSLTRLTLEVVEMSVGDLETIFWPVVKHSSILNLQLGFYQVDDMIRTLMKNRQNHANAWVSPCFILSFLRANHDHIYRDSGCPLDIVLLQLLDTNSDSSQSQRAKIVKTKFAHNICSPSRNTNSILGKRKF